MSDFSYRDFSNINNDGQGADFTKSPYTYDTSYQSATGKLTMVHHNIDKYYAANGWTAATIQYVDGKQKGNIGLYDQLTTNLRVDHPYVIDESGMIKVTEDTAYQYYQVTGVENGVIQTTDGSVFPLSDTSWFFTTKAAAEEYYYSKVGYPNPKGWLWFDQYPWVYSHEEGNWLYFKPSGDKIHYYSVRDKAWREFTPKQP